MFTKEYTKKRLYNQDNIRSRPEQRQNIPNSKTNRRTIHVLSNGMEFTTQELLTVQNPETGEWVRLTRKNYLVDASGRFTPTENIVGISWTGLLVPEDHFCVCINPWENHGYRVVYLGVDGFITELGNILCAECFKKNEAKIKLTCLLTKWIYNPIIY